MGKSEREWARERGTAWYRSKEPIHIDHPFVGDGYLSNKKWPLIEVRITPGSNANNRIRRAINIFH